ncbi:MAG: hypothetical protein ACRDRH_22860 [Pseudonocardia sp.]
MAGPQDRFAGAGTRGVDAGGSGPRWCVAGAAPRSPSPIPRRVRIAFYGRTACAHDAHAAITHQLAAVRGVLPAGALIVACFADVGAWDGLSASARTEVNDCTDWVLGEHTVTGGLVTLLRRARPQPARTADGLILDGEAPVFDVVGCSGSDRLSRKTYRQICIEDALAAHGVAFRTADGPPWNAPGPPTVISRIEREEGAMWLLRN